MPVDPSIGTDIAPLAPPANPLGTIAQFAETQNALNQNRLFQQTFAARQRMGQILSTASDPEAAWKSIMSDPQAAPFAGEAYNYYREAQLATVQMQGEVQKQGASALDSFSKNLPLLLADPSQFDNVAKAALANTPEQARPNVSTALGAMKQAFFGPEGDGKPATPEASFRRIIGGWMGMGGTSDQLKGMIGSPSQVSTGNATAFGVQQPAQYGGGFTPNNAVSMMPAPSVQTLPLGSAGTPTTGVLSGNQFTPATMAPTPVAKPQGNALAPSGANPLGSPNAAIDPAKYIADHGGIDAAIAAASKSGDDKLVISISDYASDKIRSGQGAILTGPSQAQSAANSKMGDMAGTIQEEMSSRAKELPGAIRRLDMLTGALAQFQSGGGADIRAGAGKFLQALKNAGLPGITDKMVNDVANGSLPASQVFSAEVRPLVISELKEAAQGTGRVMRSEVDAFLQMMDQTGDPRGLMSLLNQARYATQVNYDQAQKWPGYKSAVEKGTAGEGMSYGDFYNYYNQHFGKPGTLPKATGAGLNLSPVPVESARGAAPQRVTHRWNPKTGRIESVGGP